MRHLLLLALLPPLHSAHSLEPVMDEAGFQRDVLEPMERSFTLAREALRVMPKQDFSPHALVQTGIDSPNALFQWVRDETDLIPYQGTLRGPREVLMDRTGNSLDRALLLDALLHHAGVENRRLARVRLSPDQATHLHTHWADHARFQPLDAPTDEEVDREAILQQVAEDTGIDPATLSRQLNDAQFEHQSLWAEMLASVNIQLDILPEALQTSLSLHEDTLRDHRQQQIEDLRDHWRLEALINGEWVVFDPARRDISPGDAFSDTEAEHHDPANLADDLQHRLEITVIAEQWNQGELHTHTALHHQTPASSLDDQFLSLQLVPARDNPLEQSAKPGAEPTEILQRIRDLDEWLPILKVDGEPIFQSSIRQNGELNENPAAPPTVRAMGDAASALGQIGVGRRVREPDSHLSALRLDLTVHAPGRAPQTHSRYFSDILGPASRESDPSAWEITPDLRDSRALDMLGGLTLMPVTAAPSEHWVNFQHLRGWAENRRGLLGILHGSLRGQPDETRDGFSAMNHFPVDLYTIAAARSQAHPNHRVTFPNSINLLARFEIMRAGPQNASIEVLRIHDWIRNSVDVRPGADNPAHARFAQGLVDTHLEDFLTRSTDAPGTPRVNTSKQFTQDLLDGLEWRLVTSLDELSPLADAFTPDQTTRFRQALATGDHLLIRPTPVETDGLTSPLWWRYNPDNGALLGYALDGRGSAAEYIKVATIAFTVMDALIGVVLCSGLEGWEYVCCLAEVGGRAALGFGFGQALGRATAWSAEALYYAGVGFSATSAATSGLSPCNLFF